MPEYNPLAGVTIKTLYELANEHLRWIEYYQEIVNQHQKELAQTLKELEARASKKKRS